MLAPPAVQLDSPDGRGHRRQLASVLNTVAEQLFTPAPVNRDAQAADASKDVTTGGNPVLLCGFINLASGSTFTLKRDSTTLVTLYAPATGQNISFFWIDEPGAGKFTYSTNSGGHTSAASLAVVELK